MNSHSKQTTTKIVLVYEAISFAIIIIILWIDEIFDFPAILLNAPPTPVNWQESLFESGLIVLLGGIIIRFTSKILKRMRYLEGTLYVCAWCKKIRDIGQNWRAMEAYIDQRADVKFSHGICPECAEKLYPDFNPYKILNAQKKAEGKQEAAQDPIP